MARQRRFAPYAKEKCMAFSLSHQLRGPKKERATTRADLSFWSKWRDSNSRPPVPEAIGSSLLTTFVYFLVLFSPETMLSDALVRTVSTQSESVDGQRCGHRANFARLKARKLNRIYPVLSFIIVVSIAYFRKLVNIPFPKRKN